MPMATKPGRFMTFNEELPFINTEDSLTRCSCKFMLYLYYHNDYGYQTWQGGSMYWRDFLDKVTKSLNRVVLQGHVTNYICLILLPRDLWPLNSARWWVTIGGFHLKYENPLNMWFFEITWQSGIILYPLPQCLKPPKLAAWWPRVWGSQNMETKGSRFKSGC